MFSMQISVNRSPFITVFFLLICGFTFSACDSANHTEVEEVSIQDHIYFLSDENLNGRLAGTAGEATAANYVADQFLSYGLLPAGDEGTYVQQFVLQGPIPQAMEMENYISRNVVGFIEGTDSSGQYIIIGAHYDSQGMGGMISMDNESESSIHPGADDNASGTAGLLHLADYFSENTPSKNMLFIAFSGEELGLLGSRHFVEQMKISPDSIGAMINLDMIGRMTDNQLTIFGTGTSDRWNEIIDSAENDSLKITRIPSGSGASDHASFYEAGIPVLHYFTGTHENYHRSSDTADKVNFQGIRRVTDHIIVLVEELDEIDAMDIGFIESTDPHSATFEFEGPTLGVLPDYSYSGLGFRIESVRDGEAADIGGMRDGDVIVQIDNIVIADIYDYMESLSEFKRGDQVNVTVMRDGEEVTINIRF